MANDQQARRVRRQEGSWGTFWASSLGTVSLSYLTGWGWGASLIAGAVASNNSDGVIRSAGNGMLMGVGVSTVLLVGLIGTATYLGLDAFMESLFKRQGLSSS